MSSNRYCKCHFFEGESEHWGLLDRKAFAHKGASPHYTPDIEVSPEHLILEVNFDWVKERVWGKTQYNLLVKGHDVEEITLDAVNLEVSRVLIGRKSVNFEKISPLKSSFIYLSRHQILALPKNETIINPHLMRLINF